MGRESRGQVRGRVGRVGPGGAGFFQLVQGVSGIHFPDTFSQEVSDIGREV